MIAVNYILVISTIIFNLLFTLNLTQFKIVCNPEQKTLEQLVDNPPVLEYGPDGIKIFEVECCYNKGNVCLYCPKLDSEGKPIQVGYDNKDFKDKLVNIIKMVNSPVPIGDNLPEQIVLGVAYQPKLTDYGYEIANIMHIWSNGLRNGSGIVFGDKNKGFGDWPYNVTLSYLDSDYNYILWGLVSDGFKVFSASALNPDYVKKQRDYLGYQKMVSWLDDIPITYGDESDDLKGFIWIDLNNIRAVVAGKDVIMPVGAERKNQILCVPLQWLCKNLKAEYFVNQDKESISVYRRYYGSWEKEFVSNITLKINDDIVIVNGIEKKLSRQTYLKEGKLMVPIEDICKYLNAEYHFRAIDNSILIGRFPKSES